jgi:hypothetical protein
MNTDRAFSTIRNRRSHLLMQSVRQLRNLRDSLRQRIARHYRPPAVPNGGVTVFDNRRIEEQIRAVHQLELWRAAREAVMQNINCPTRPRFLKGLLTPAEQEHVLFCSHCQVTQRSIPFFELRRHLRRLNMWRVSQVHHSSAFLNRHKKVTLFPLMAQLLLLIVGVYFVNLTLSARSSTNTREVSSEASLDAVRSMIDQTDEQLLLEKIDGLQNEILHLKKAQNLHNQRAALLMQIRRKTGSGSAEARPQEAQFVLRCDTADQRASLWCLPSKEIKRRQEAIENYLRVYKDFAAKRESFTIKNRETVPRGRAQGFSPPPSDSTMESFPPLASNVVAHRY